jgi:Tetracyclin repressor-like, C-terminal domain
MRSSARIFVFTTPTCWPGCSTATRGSSTPCGTTSSRAAATLPLEEVVDQMLEAVVAFTAERPAFWALFHGSAMSAPLADAGLTEVKRVAIGYLGPVLGPRSDPGSPSTIGPSPGETGPDADPA